jgi:4-amino-4-deoxy-L-arabinose transferase-like glycosyltransferase
VIASLMGERGSVRRWWSWIIVITLAGLAVRVAYILLFRLEYIEGTFPTPEGGTTYGTLSGEPFRTRLWGDGYVYSHQARLIMDGKGLIAPFPHYIHGVYQQAADHPPLYILYLTAFTALGIRGDLSHMLVSAPAAALAALTFGLLARRIWSPRAGIIAALIGAFNPSVIHFPGFALSETLTLPLTALLALFLYRLWQQRTWFDAAMTGFLCGVTALCRPDITMMIPLAIVPMVLLLRDTAFRRKFALLCVAGAACVLPVAPWIAYNLHRYEKTVTLSVGFDYSLAQGSCDQTYYGELIGYYFLPCMGERLVGTDLELADQSLGAAHLREETVEYIKDHLARTPLVVAARVGRVIGVFRPIQQAGLEHVTEQREAWLANLAVLSYYPLAAASIIGAVLLRRRGTPIMPLVAMIASALIGAAITLAVLRYRASAEPAFAVLAAVAIDQLIRWIQSAWRDTPDAVPSAG